MSELLVAGTIPTKRDCESVAKYSKTWKIWFSLWMKRRKDHPTEPLERKTLIYLLMISGY